MEPLPSLANQEKRIAALPVWSEPEALTQCVWFNAPLEINGIVETGLSLHGVAYLDQPDRHVSFSVYTQIGRRKFPIARFDWKDPKGGHTNPRRKPRIPNWSGKRLKATHFHDFDMNWIEEKGIMRDGNLPMGRDFSEEFHTFESARDFAGKLLKINNIGIVLPPKWEYNLFDDA